MNVYEMDYFDEYEFDFILAEDVEFEGEIEADSALIAGKVKGSVKIRKVAVLEKKAVVKGTVKSKQFYSKGFLEGNLEADEVSLLEDSSLNGDIKCENIFIDTKAFFNGHCEMQKKVPIEIENEK